MLSLETGSILLENRFKIRVVFPDAEILKKPMQDETQYPPSSSGNTVFTHPFNSPNRILVNFPFSYFENPFEARTKMAPCPPLYIPRIFCAGGSAGKPCKRFIFFPSY